MTSDLLLYTGFAAVVTVLLAVDLLVVHRDTHQVSLREAGTWSAIWIGVAVGFGLLVPHLHGGDGATIDYFTAYVIEKSLSVDNVFVFVLIFQALAVPKAHQHRVLFYGVVGAIVMRTILIFTGAAMLDRFEWLLYVFGAFLLWVAWKTWRQRHEHQDPTDSAVIRAVRRLLPTTDGYRGERFVVREPGKRGRQAGGGRSRGRLLVTPLFVVLVLVEFSDLIFAADSIPAVFAITRDPFIVLTSNVFAILGLRALYFLLAGVADRLPYLTTGLAVILAFVGLKLLTEGIDGLWHPTPLQSLAFIAAVLAAVVVASLRSARAPAPATEPLREPSPVLYEESIR